SCPSSDRRSRTSAARTERSSARRASGRRRRSPTASRCGSARYLFWFVSTTSRSRPSRALSAHDEPAGPRKSRKFPGVSRRLSRCHRPILPTEVGDERAPCLSLLLVGPSVLRRVLRVVRAPRFRTGLTADPIHGAQFGPAEPALPPEGRMAGAAFVPVRE